MDEIHRCGRCDRKLRNPEAIERGFGKTCYKKVQAARAQAELEKSQQKLDLQTA